MMLPHLISGAGKQSKLFDPLYALVVAFYGQSNTQGSGDTSLLPSGYSAFGAPIPGIKYWVNASSEFQTIDPTTNTVADARSTYEFGPEVSFAVHLKARLVALGITKDLYIVKHGRGGTKLAQDGAATDLNPNSTGETYDEFQERLTDAKAAIVATNKIPYFLGLMVYTGETDSLNSAHYDIFDVSLGQLYDAFYTDSRAASATPVPKMGLVKVLDFSSGTPTIRSKIDSYAAANSFAYSVDAVGLDTLDSQHLSTEGIIDVGEALSTGLVIT